MSDIIVMDKADEAIAFTGAAVTDLDGLLSGVPGLLGSLPTVVTDVVDHVAVDVLGGLNLDLDELADLDDLDGALSQVLGIVPSTVGGLVAGLGVHVDHTVDVVLDQTLSLTSVLNPVLEPVADIVAQITSTLGVTDELPARLQALAGIAIVGSDSVLSNLTEILDATLGLGLGATVDHTLTAVLGVADELALSLGLGSVLDVVDVGVTEGPVTVQSTADESADASHGLLDALLADVDGAGQAHLGSDVVVGVQGLVHSVPELLDSTVAVAGTDTLQVPVPEVVDHTTDTVDTLLVDPTAVDLGAELGYTLSSVDLLVDETVAGLGLNLDGLG